jgi:hypothetical protein
MDAEISNYPNYKRYVRDKRCFDWDNMMQDKKFRAEYEEWLDDLNKEVTDGNV